MKHSQCPVCYSPFEVRTVTPCFICGGITDVVKQFDKQATFTEYRLPNGRLITLCRVCELEEFMVPGGWGYRLSPDPSFPIDALQRVRAIEQPTIRNDKFCPSCNLRFAFLELHQDFDDSTLPAPETK